MLLAHSTWKEVEAYLARSRGVVIPLGSTELLRPAAMVNLLGDLWEGGEPNWAGACAIPNARLHLYGKSAPRPGRKMGHVSFVATTLAAAQSQCEAACRILGIQP